MDSLSKIYGQQPDIYVLIQTVAEGNHTRHASSVYDPLPLDAEMQFLRQAMPGLVHADLVSSDSLSGECSFSPVSSHLCCQNGGKEKNEAAFGPWLSMFRARLCQERVLERSIQRGRPYDRVIRWRPDLALCDAVETLEWITRATPNCSAGFLRDYAWVVPYPILSEFNHFLGQRMLDHKCGTKHPDEEIKKAIVADKKRTFYPHTDTGATFVHSSSITFHFQDWNGNFAQLQRHAAGVGLCNGKDIWNTSDYANVTTSTNFDGETLLVLDGLFNRTVNFPTIRRQESRLQSAIEKQHKRVGKASSPGTVFSPQCTPLEEAKRKERGEKERKVKERNERKERKKGERKESGSNEGEFKKQRRYYSEPGPTRMKKQSTWFNSSYPCAGRARMHAKINTGVASGAAKQPDLDASRVAILIPVHPPKYDYAKRYLASAKIAQAHTVSDTFFILSPQDEEESFRATFPNITQEFHLILYEQSGIEVVDNLIKPPKTGHKQPADWAVRKKIGGLQKLHEMIMLGNVHPYRFAVVADAELLWARSAVGFAAAVSQRADAPHWHGTCHLNDRVPAVSSTWQVFSQNMSKSDYLSAIAILQAGCTETRNPLNTHFVDMPIYDMSRWQRYANFLDSLRTSCDSTTLKQLGAFEQPLYIYWSLVVERHGNLTTIERTFSTYPWLERMRGHAYPGMIDLLDSSGVLWAPLQVLVSAPTTCTVPKSVYLFFHTDSIENKAVGRGCCGELSPGYTGVAERPYCTEKKPSVPRSAKSGAGLP